MGAVLARLGEHTVRRRRAETARAAATDPSFDGGDRRRATALRVELAARIPLTGYAWRQTKIPPRHQPGRCSRLRRRRTIGRISPDRPASSDGRRQADALDRPLPRVRRGRRPVWRRDRPANRSEPGSPKGPRQAWRVIDGMGAVPHGPSEAAGMGAARTPGASATAARRREAEKAGGERERFPSGFETTPSVSATLRASSRSEGWNLSAKLLFLVPFSPIASMFPGDSTSTKGLSLWLDEKRGSRHSKHSFDTTIRSSRCWWWSWISTRSARQLPKTMPWWSRPITTLPPAEHTGEGSICSGALGFRA